MLKFRKIEFTCNAFLLVFISMSCDALLMHELLKNLYMIINFYSLICLWLLVFLFLLTSCFSFLLHLQNLLRTFLIFYFGCSFYDCVDEFASLLILHFALTITQSWLKSEWVHQSLKLILTYFSVFCLSATHFRIKANSI